MKKSFVLFFVVFVSLGLFFISASNAKVQDIEYSHVKVQKSDVKSLESAIVKRDPDFGNIPLYFIPNKGQVDEKARFYAKTSRYTLWMTKEGLVFDSMKRTGTIDVNEDTMPPGEHKRKRRNSSFITHHSSFDRNVSRLVFLGANKNPEMVPIKMTPHKVNYFKGKDPSKWQTGIRTSKAVLYKGIYKSIDLKVYGIGKQIEYDWSVKPGGNPGDIRFEYKNVKGTRIDDEGNMLVETDFGELMHKRPFSYQFIDNEKIEVEAGFKKINKNTYGFKVGEYDKSCELIIDPIIVPYSTYLGGTGNDYGKGIAVDSSGFVYVTGITCSPNFPSLHEYQGDQGNCDVFIAKIDTTQCETSSLIYSTYLGGSEEDGGNAIAVDSSGYVYVTGYTFSDDFPTLNPYQPERGPIETADAFVSKMGTTQTGDLVLLYSTYLGGNSHDYGMGIAVDNSENAYVAGYTYSTNFPIRNSVQPHQYNYDAFVTRVDTTLSGDLSLIYSTYLGGINRDRGYGIALDTSGIAYVTGYTESEDFPILNECQAYQGKHDAFVTGIDTTQVGAPSLVYSTYLGGGDDDEGNGIAADGSGFIYVAGYTESDDFPTKNPYQPVKNEYYNTFITKMDTTNQWPDCIVYSTYLGGVGYDFATGIAVDSSGYVYIVGRSSGADFPIKDYYQPNQNAYDVIVAKIDTTMGDSGLIYSTYLGGNSTDYGTGIAVDSSGNAYVVGETMSTDFPIICEYQGDPNPEEYDFNAFVTKINAYPISIIVTTAPVSSVTSNSASCGGNVISDGGSTVTARGLCWSTSHNPTLLDDHTECGSGLGEFTCSITGLTPDTTYYVKAYATNMAGTVYGNEVTFTTCAFSNSSPVLVVNKTLLNFAVNSSGTTTGDQGFLIRNIGGGTLNWTITDDADWLECDPENGTNFGVVTVSVDASGLSPDTYTGSITITDANAINSPQTIAVTLTVYDPGGGLPVQPFGFFETPGDGAEVKSSVPVTGWALDDIEVVSVQLYREVGPNLIYIGDALFVEGARPDVAQIYPQYPYNSRAGWGYMMLTNSLLDGTYVLHAIATDKEGNKVTLGTKTITIINVTAVKPFGAIDFPAPGGTASGSNYRVLGWALTPPPNKIPSGGVHLYVDGVDLGEATYDIFRQDVYDLFPGYENRDGALAYYDLNTIGCDNGMHTVHFVATDDDANTDGIGSRYFNIWNLGTINSVSQASGQKFYSMPEIIKIPVDYSGPVEMKKGYNANIEPEAVYPDENGNITIEIRELERIEVRLFQVGSREETRLAPLYSAPLLGCTGYQVTGDRLTPLPIGSTLDTEKGIFYWSPGPGFIGEYQLVFVEKGPDGAMNKKLINVKIVPKFGK